MLVPPPLFSGELRRRWRGAALVGLVLGIGFAAVLTAAAGARRTETAFPRMLAATGGTQLLVSSTDEDPMSRRRLYEKVAALDGVDRTGLIAAVELVPMRVPRGAGTAIESCASLSIDGVFRYDLDRPNLLEGRLPRRDRSDEILVTDGYARTFGVGVGDRLDLVLPGRDHVPAAGEASAADGTVIPATIVGVGTLATQIVPLSDLDAAPIIVVPPALGQRYAPDQRSWCFDGAVAALKPGTDATRVAAEIHRLTGTDSGALVQDRASNHAEVRRAIQPQVTALWLFAAVAAVAALLIVAQLLGRQLQQAAATSTPVWRALGATRFQARVLVAAPTLVTALVGGGVALGGAVLLSGRFPIGPARQAETRRGIELHSGIHFGGAGVAALAVLVIGVVVTVMATHGSTHTSRRRWLARLGGRSSRPALLVGIHLATGSLRDEAAVPVRSAATGAAVAVAALVATMTFYGGLDDLVSEPARYGRDWDVMLDGAFGPVPVAAVLRELGQNPAVGAVAGGRYGEVTIDGTRVPTIGLTDLEGTTFPAIIDGRAPTRGDEIVLGTRSLIDLRRSLGDTVTVDTGTGPRDMTIVGTAAFPRLNRGSFSTLGLGIGAVTRTEALPPYDLEVSDPPPDFDTGDYAGPRGDMFEFVTVRTRRGATPAARSAVISSVMDMAAVRGQLARTEQRPTAIDNYAAVRSTPTLLAGLLGAMAAATLAHLVVTVVRRRRRDLALCVALGMRRAQVLRAVVIQALLVANVALLIGLPLGMAAGRIAWRAFAADLGVVDTIQLPIAGLALLVPVVDVVAITVAVVPAIIAARIRPAVALRTE